MGGFFQSFTEMGELERSRLARIRRSHCGFLIFFGIHADHEFHPILTR
jgi:hypothetical protein